MADQGAGLRGIVGAGGTRVSVSAAMRVRDRGRPDAAEIAAAEEEIDRRLTGLVGSAPRPARRTAARPADRTPGSPVQPARGTPTPAEVGSRSPRRATPVAGAGPVVGPVVGPTHPGPHPPGGRRTHGRGGSSPSAS